MILFERRSLFLSVFKQDKMEHKQIKIQFFMLAKIKMVFASS